MGKCVGGVLPRAVPPHRSLESCPYPGVAVGLLWEVVKERKKGAEVFTQELTR